MDRYVTISVDDGHPTDLRTADLLNKYGLAATFYIPAKNPERPVMSIGQIREISSGFEVGGHTMNHVSLNRLSRAEAWSEINDGKLWLENVLGHQAVSFCYPRGKFDNTVASLVELAGFSGARTCLLNLSEFPRKRFSWGVSTHASRYSRIIQVRHALHERNFAGLRNFFQVYRGSTDWPCHFRHALNYVEAHGGIAHLYLHSWEIDRAGEWKNLEFIFKSIAEYKNIAPVTNGLLFMSWRGRHNEGAEKN